MSRIPTKSTLASLGVTPSKKRGQSFLVRGEVAERIAALAALTPRDAVLEIGPGLGALTGALLASAGRVVAVESDRRLAGWLRGRHAGAASFELIHGDALEVDLGGIFDRLEDGGRRAAVVSNIPYSISGPLIARLMAFSRRWTRMVLTVQRELARRLTAHPGGRGYGGFTALCRCRADVEEAFTIAPGAFYPRPAVESSVVVFTPSMAPVFPPGREEDCLSLVRLLFSQKRKSVSSILRRATARHPAQGRLAEILAAAGVDPSMRAERLDLQDFLRLADALGGRGWGPPRDAVAARRGVPSRK